MSWTCPRSPCGAPESSRTRAGDSGSGGARQRPAMGNVPVGARTFSLAHGSMSTSSSLSFRLMVGCR
eukprot:scaffold1549_cov350-Prasinococcus_capsulatus_cf.AAC.31